MASSAEKQEPMIAVKLTRRHVGELAVLSHSAAGQAFAGQQFSRAVPRQSSAQHLRRPKVPARDQVCANCERKGRRGFVERNGRTVCASRRACLKREQKGTRSGSGCFYLGGRRGAAII